MGSGSSWSTEEVTLVDKVTRVVMLHVWPVVKYCHQEKPAPPAEPAWQPSAVGAPLFGFGWYTDSWPVI